LVLGLGASEFLDDWTVPAGKGLLELCLLNVPAEAER